MSRKVIFFDVDGTLVSFNGEIPQSTLQAIDLAKEQGHKIFLCTGRSLTQLTGPVLQIPVDGIVGAAGACVKIGDEVVFESVIDKEQEELFLRLFEDQDISFGVQTIDGTYTTTRGWEKTKERFLKAGVSMEAMEANTELFKIQDDLRSLGPVEKLFYNNSPYTVDYVREQLGDYFHVELSSFDVKDPYSGEITKEGVDKSTGMEVVLQHYGLTQQDSVAFGDGPNDLEMLQYAAIGIAMGNAVQEAKDVANYVTTDLLEDGIYNGMKHFQLI